MAHIFLAFTTRSERQPLWKLGLFSNRTMLVWAVAVIGTLVVVTALPQAREAVKLGSMSLGSWLLTVGVPFAAIFWQELLKWGRTKLTH